MTTFIIKNLEELANFFKKLSDEETLAGERATIAKHKRHYEIRANTFRLVSEYIRHTRIESVKD